MKKFLGKNEIFLKLEKLRKENCLHGKNIQLQEFVSVFFFLLKETSELFFRKNSPKYFFENL